VEAALGGLEGDSFRNRQQQTLSFNQGDFDFTFTFSRNDLGTFFDAEGDRIASSNASLDNTETLNFNAKLGVDLTQEQRLQLTFNRTRDRRNLESVVETTSGKAIGVEKDFDFEGNTEPKISNTLFNLSYSHEDLLNSEVQAQLFYREEFQRSLPFDIRPNSFRGGIGVFNNIQDNDVWGARLQADTSFGENTDLTIGADYEAQDFGRFFFNELSGSAFDQGTIRETGQELINVPPFELNTFGLFAQLQWEATEWLSLSGGIRNEQFDFQADSFTSRAGNFVEGGEIDFDGTVFNAGVVADLSEQVNVFAKFSQGFSAPTLGFVGFPSSLGFAPTGFSIQEDIEQLQPQKIDEYEIGIRGNWESVNATLSAFYNFSERGATFRATEDVTAISELVRSPKRIYGIEGTLDWELADHWQLGGTFSWNEGEIDPNDDDDFQPLSSSDIQPLKVTAYVENQTTPGWNNRLQLLVVGSRDRAFEEDVDPTSIESYAVLDYISSIEIGDGTLSIGIENLLDNQFFPVFRQIGGARNPDNQIAAPGRTISVNYSITW
jgi:iron complex outermembrane receptor protein